MLNSVAELDRTLSLWVHSYETPWLNAFWRTVTHGGDWWTLLLVTCAGAALFLWRAARPRAAFLLALAFSLSYLINPLLKRLVRRSRPQLWEVLQRPADFSFPSGHAMSSMMIYGVLAVLLAELYPAQRRSLFGLAVLWIGLVGFSRIYLGVHWPSDVVAGWAFGFALVFALARWYRLGQRVAPEPHSPPR